MWKIAAGVVLALGVALGVTLWRNAVLSDRLAREQETVALLHSEIAAREAELDQTREAARIASQALRQLQEQQREAQRVAEAIVAGDMDALDNIPGPVGKALRLLATVKCGEVQ